MFETKKQKQQREWIEGFSMMEDGLKVQLGIFKNRLFNCRPEEKENIETLIKYAEYVLSQMEDVWNGNLHY